MGRKDDSKERCGGEGDHGPRIGGAGLVLTDIEASNGVIHVIDAVLLPE